MPMNKLTLGVLKKSGEINFELGEIKRDFKGFPDIEKINHAQINGSYKFITENKLVLVLEIETELTILCSLSLKEVLVPLNFKLDIVFSNDEEADYPIEPVIELDEIIIGNIINEAPYNVYA